MSEQSNGQNSVETQSWKRKILICLFGVAAMTAMYLFGFPWIEQMLNRVYAAEAHIDKNVASITPRGPAAAFGAVVVEDGRVREAA